MHALTMRGGKLRMERTPANPTSQTAGVKMAVLDPTGILAGAGLRGSMARMHGVLAARAGKGRGDDARSPEGEQEDAEGEARRPHEA